jgi:hypothetical protein
MFGGDTRGERLADLWLFYPHFQMWHKPLLCGTVPPPRCVHAAAIRCVISSLFSVIRFQMFLTVSRVCFTFLQWVTVYRVWRRCGG